MLLAQAISSVNPSESPIEILRDLLLKVRIPQVAHKLFRQSLSLNEQRTYEEDCQHRGGAIRLDHWIARHRQIPHEVAIVHLAFMADLLSLSDRDWLLRDLGEAFPIDWEIQHAVSLGGLVIVDEPPTVFWEGLNVGLRWTDKPKMWQAFSQLATKSRMNAPLTESDLYTREAPSNSTLANVIGRLKKELPPTLGTLIRPGTARRTHRLHLDRDRIRIFKPGQSEVDFR